jgi:hypothetical protein
VPATAAAATAPASEARSQRQKWIGRMEISVRSLFVDPTASRLIGSKEQDRGRRYVISSPDQTDGVFGTQKREDLSDCDAITS